MKDKPLANCEREFLLQLIERTKRLDDRRAFDYRNIKIEFGADYGCCHVHIGETLILAQVTCSMIEPKQTRPNEGALMINIEFNHVACPGFEPGRLSRKGVQINRLLERCLKECKCIDLESLCVIAEKQVWEVRVDVKVLNHAGNILDACSLAAISALAHFRRPDVTVSDGKVFIHPEDEKAYIPLSVHHMPICTSFSFFHSGKYLLFDASYEEERVMEGQMIIAMNKHREICALHMSGTHLLHKDQVKRCTNIAASKVMQLDELVHRALQNDKESRDRGDGPSSAELNTYTKIDVASKEVKKNLKLRPDVEKGVSSDDMGAGDSDRQVETGSDSDEQVDESDEQVDDSDEQVSAGGADEMDTVTDEHWSSEKAKIAELQATAEVGLGGQSTWGLLEQEVPLSEQTKMIARKRKSREKRKAKPPSSDSEEEETVTLSTPG